MRLSHFSYKPITKVTSVDNTGRVDFKPRGLWVSVDGEDDWESWNEREHFRDTASQIRYRVNLSPEANIFRIEEYAQLEAFSELFGSPSYGSFPGPVYIDWGEVSSIWQGVIIAPYFWEGRYAFSWYTGWDCASGCVWDASAVASLKEVSNVRTSR